jgi:hypothetical protein
MPTMHCRLGGLATAFDPSSNLGMMLVSYKEVIRPTILPAHLESSREDSAEEFRLMDGSFNYQDMIGSVDA